MHNPEQARQPENNESGKDYSFFEGESTKPEDNLKKLGKIAEAEEASQAKDDAKAEQLLAQAEKNEEKTGDPTIDALLSRRKRLQLPKKES